MTIAVNVKNTCNASFSSCPVVFSSFVVSVCHTGFGILYPEILTLSEFQDTIYQNLFFELQEVKWVFFLRQMCAVIFFNHPQREGWLRHEPVFTCATYTQARSLLRQRGWVSVCAGTKFQEEPRHIPQMSPKWAWIGNFKPNGPNIKIAISRKILKRSTCNFRRMLRPWNSSRGWSAMTSYEIQDGGRPPFWKSKIHSNSAAHRLFPPNFAWQRRYRRKF